ncbi:hypothetical protein CSOJ01_09722 [Colletotrichum sojae]|uniref:Uncharacterized protein n=1 Tax=Colletotrichum sojae TaxID=2175907 RepID=A0A8H6J261_9PEZI|nr:hypothetical protein CSOJ01_09722 [Colletotrichum sojae]
MCYQIAEHYSSCKCLYYQHAVDRCAHYGRLGHSIRRETILIGDAYACHNHDYAQSPRVTTTSEDPLKTGSTEAMDAKSTPRFRLRPRPGTSSIGVSCHSTISKDYTAGEGARKAELFACFGRRLRGGKGVGSARRSEERPRVESVDTEDGHAAAEYEYESKLVRDTHLGQRHGDINPQNVLNFVPSPMAESGRDGRAIQQQQLQAAMQNGGMANIPIGSQMTPQQQNQFLQQQLQQRLMLQQQQQQQQQHQQQQQQQQQRGRMGNMMTQQLAQRYAQQLNQMGGGQMSPQMQAQIQAQLQAQMANPMQRAQMAGQAGGGQNMMNGQNLNMQAMLQMQQQQAMNQTNQAVANQVRQHGVAIYNKSIGNFAATWGGKTENIPPDQLEAFKRSCMVEAKNYVTSLMAQRRAQQVMMQQRAVKYAEEPDTQRRQMAEQAEEIFRLRTRVDKSTDVVAARRLRSHHPPAKSSPTTSVSYARHHVRKMFTRLTNPI